MVHAGNTYMLVTQRLKLRRSLKVCQVPTSDSNTPALPSFCHDVKGTEAKPEADARSVCVLSSVKLTVAVCFLPIMG